MIPTQAHIERIGVKLTRLVKAYALLDGENERLKLELAAKQETETQLRDQMRLLDRQLQLLKAASGEMDDQGRKELQKQLNHYIREIDRCIALLGE